jgi:hypothetical protein
VRPVCKHIVALSILVLPFQVAIVDVCAARTPHAGTAGPARSAAVLDLDSWTYFRVDDSRDAAYFGLDMADVTGDAYGDIVSGRYFYRNPGSDLSGAWARATFPMSVDGVLFVDVDDDDRGDVIGQWTDGSGLNFYWLEANDAQGSSWSSVTQVSNIPVASHTPGSQGHHVAQIEAGGKPEIVVTSGNGLYYFEIPVNPAGGNWPVTHVNANPTDEGFGVGDIDGDGDLDLAAGTGNSKRVEWYENPGDGSAGWAAHHIGDMTEATWTDRFAIADLNGDAKPDIVGTEENGTSYGAGTWWWEQPADPESANWTRHQIVEQATTNAMDVADMDDDGDVDVILGEHRGDRKLAIWENDGSGNFTQHVVDTGKESHLGARVADLDGDGDMEIVSICYDTYQYLHLWRNDALDSNSPALLQGYSATYDEGSSGVVLEWRLADVGVDMRFYVLRSDAAGSSYHELQNAHVEGTDMAYAFRDGAVEPGAWYRYRVDVTDELGRRTLFETATIEVPVVSLTLYQAVPNPFNPHTTIAYAIPKAGHVTLGIYDARGGLVRRLVDEIQAAGLKEATWDGRDSRGERVSSGVYFSRLELDGRSQSRKITVLK